MSDLLDDIPPPDYFDVEGYYRASAQTRATIVVIPVTPDDALALDQLRVLMKLPTRLDVIVELLRRAAPSPNGSAYEVTCHGCGKKFTLKRRPAPGRRSWCDTCKASGEPAAQRARDYRERKSGGE